MAEKVGKAEWNVVGTGWIRRSVGGQKLNPGGQSLPPVARLRVCWRCSERLARQWNWPLRGGKQAFLPIGGGGHIYSD
ncbi:uncharacterized protein PGTG_22388 [Puccinia graminis f. sp. tritici CRL 75-36-700-3]|uniref:Uncharacterized protein n=1 Tax=Puccinia graminis f. sp. tritici (strain CRL 75-36-700-3 / race SCCL) TaxID=418459 RepID=H6QUD7_PUCGT|nr:uncharacterized protein PGTG_22388 [Puccinia graminis f. sp. tritici CRL 75-36-700-3]EHS64600.1 hypothetical protein PGTG_22388 [Puccinia graminis f. sp. tritici CRL 75-36-700-3]